MEIVTASLDQQFVTDLRPAVAGDMITPENESYHDARALWNGRIDRFPGVVVRVTSTDDVAAAIRFAREADLRIAVRGGGHHVTGSAVVDDGLVVDLSDLTGVTVDGDALTASADENPDLFWGVCGGGASFGIVTEFEFDCFEFGPEVAVAQVPYPVLNAEATADLLPKYREFTAGALRGTTSMAIATSVPPLPFVPGTVPRRAHDVLRRIRRRRRPPNPRRPATPPGAR